MKKIKNHREKSVARAVRMMLDIAPIIHDCSIDLRKDVSGVHAEGLIAQVLMSAIWSAASLEAQKDGRIPSPDLFAKMARDVAVLKFPMALTIKVQVPE